MLYSCAHLGEDIVYGRPVVEDILSPAAYDEAVRNGSSIWSGSIGLSAGAALG
jgi:hypothetical protein